MVNGNFSFNKAIESIAAMKLHNYAMRRRQNMSQKLKVSPIPPPVHHMNDSNHSINNS